MKPDVKSTWRVTSPFDRLTLTIHFAANAETFRQLGWRVMRIA